MTTNALAAADLLAKDGIEASVVHFHTVKPLDEATVLDFARDAELVVTIEEGIRIGGLGSAITDVLVDQLGTAAPPVKRLGIPDEFPHNYGLQEDFRYLWPDAEADRGECRPGCEQEEQSCVAQPPPAMCGAIF